MNEELRSLYKKLVQYYDGLEEILKPTNEEKDIIICISLIVNMYKKAKHIKEEHLAFDRNTCVEFMRVLDLSCDKDLFMSLSNPEQYNKEYSDEEIEGDIELNEIKNMSVLEIEEEIKKFSLYGAYVKFYLPLERLRPYFISHKKDKDEIAAKLLSIFEIFKEVDDTNNYDTDIITEIISDKIRDSFNEEISEEKNTKFIDKLIIIFNNVTNLFNNISQIDPDDLSSMCLLNAVYYYMDHRYIIRLSVKEQKLLKPYFDGITASLRESYPGNQSSILVEKLNNVFANTDFANTVFDKIHNCPELCWVYVNLPAIAVSGEWSVPKDFFSRTTSNNSKEFIGVVCRLYRDPDFIKAVVDELANMNNIAPTPLTKQWTLFLLTGIEKPQSDKPSGSIWKGEVNDLLYICKYLYKDPDARVNAISGLYKKAVELFGAITDKEDKDLSAYTERPKNKNLISLFQERINRKR